LIAPRHTFGLERSLRAPRLTSGLETIFLLALPHIRCTTFRNRGYPLPTPPNLLEGCPTYLPALSACSSSTNYRRPRGSYLPNCREEAFSETTFPAYGVLGTHSSLGCVYPSSVPESLTSSVGPFVNRRPHSLAAQAPSPVLFADDRYPHGVGVMLTRSFVDLLSLRT
jgi:hypothetical protein